MATALELLGDLVGGIPMDDGGWYSNDTALRIRQRFLKVLFPLLLDTDDDYA